MAHTMKDKNYPGGKPSLPKAQFVMDLAFRTALLVSYFSKLRKENWP